MPSLPLRLGLHALGLVTGLFLGCVASGGVSAGAAYDYFAAPGPHDAWSTKIREWQGRALRPGAVVGQPGPASVSGAGEAPDPERDARALRQKFEAFRAEQKLATARQVAAWIQAEARDHYEPDGAVDTWATLETTLERGVEDCDGLELLANRLLRDLGFAEGEVYRAIVYRPSDGQHHMVTFWFERPDDPWVIDPTGAMTTGMPRMSEMPEWVPLKVFSDHDEFTVRRTAASTLER